MNYREIGSDFELDLKILNKSNNDFLNKEYNKKNTLFLSSGREALKYILKSDISTLDKILLPAYLCESVLKPVKELDIEFQFYSLNKDLSINFEDLRDKITKKISHILVINYFGKQQNLKNLENLTNDNAVIIEDITHTLFNKDKKYNSADYQFASLRKWFSIPDGGIIKTNNKLDIKLEKNSYNEFVFKNLLASILKKNYLDDEFNEKDYYLKIYEEANKFYDNKIINPTSITDISKEILNKYDFELLRNQRKDNYNFLYSIIKNDFKKHITPLTKKLNKSETPLGLPIICNRRDDLRKHLINNDIYPPIHWNLPSEILVEKFKLPHEISNNILTIPCDHRYNIKDMKRIIEVVNKFYK
jgi:dTDP-4-amino-4,6-dideoxygalactose transaminase